MVQTPLGRSPSRPDLGLAHLGAAVGLVLFVVAFPFAVGAVVERFGVRAVAAALLAAGCASAVVARRRDATPLLGSLALLSPLVLGLVLGERRLLLLVPALAYLLLAWTFERSTTGPVSLIERGARLIQPRAPDFVGPYCHALTRFWAALFAAHAAVIVVLAWWAPHGWWVAWTTWGFWGLCAVISAAEFFVRKIHFRYYLGGPLDRALAHFFPAEATEQGRRSIAYVHQTRAEMARGEYGPER